MARPLTNTKSDGALYERPPAVEAQIDEAVRLPRCDLQARLLIPDRNDLGYLRSECLVHLVREGRRAGDQQLMSAVLPVLLGRCEANLLVKVPDGGATDAASLRQEILENLTDLFVTDGTSDFPGELDFYECRFNKAFRALRIDAVRRAARRRKRSIAVVDMPPSEAAGEPDAYEDPSAVSTAVSRAMSHFQNRLHAVTAGAAEARSTQANVADAPNPFSGLSRSEFRAFATRLNANAVFAGKLRDRQINPATMTPGFRTRVVNCEN